MSMLEKFKGVNLSIIVSHKRIKLKSIEITNDLQRQIHETQISDEFIKKISWQGKRMEKILA